MEVLVFGWDYRVEVVLLVVRRVLGRRVVGFSKEFEDSFRVIVIFIKFLEIVILFFVRGYL